MKILIPTVAATFMSISSSALAENEGVFLPEPEAYTEEGCKLLKKAIEGNNRSIANAERLKEEFPSLRESMDIQIATSKETLEENTRVYKYGCPNDFTPIN